MFYWAKYCCHDNTAGNKSALNKGFDLFSENLVTIFFHYLSLQNLEKYRPIAKNLVKF